MADPVVREQIKTVLKLPLLLACFCIIPTSASRTDLIPNIILKQHSTPIPTNRVLPVDEEQLKARSRIYMPREYPSNDNDCKENWWTCGAPSKLVKTIAKHIGIHHCINFPRDKYGAEYMIRKGGHVLGVPTYTIENKIIDKFNLTQLYPHVRDNLCALVHRIPPVRLSITRSFLQDMWMATGATLVVAASALHVAGLRPAWFHVIAIFITGGFPESRPGRSVVSAATRNAISLLLSILSLIVCNAFTGMFMTFLAAPQEVSQINTIAELANWVDIAWAEQSVKKTFENAKDDEMLQKLYQHSRNITDTTDASYRHFLQRPRDAFIHAEKILGQFSATFNYKGKDGQPLIHMMHECLLSPGFLAFMVNKHWHFKDRFDAYLQRLVNAGIVDKMERDAKLEFKTILSRWHKHNPLTIPPPPGAGEANGPEPLPLATMWEPGALLGVGLGLATVAFLAEIAPSRMALLARLNLWRRRMLCKWRWCAKW